MLSVLTVSSVLPRFNGLPDFIHLTRSDTLKIAIRLEVHKSNGNELKVMRATDYAWAVN